MSNANICPVCFKHFNTKAHLKQHLNKKYKCSKNAEPELTSSSDNTQINDDSTFNTYNALLNDVKKKHAIYVQCKNQNNILTKENKYLKNQLINIANTINSCLIFCQKNQNLLVNKSDEDIDNSNSSTNSSTNSNIEKATVSTLTDISSKYSTPDMNTAIPMPNCNVLYNIDKTQLVQIPSSKIKVK